MNGQNQNTQPKLTPAHRPSTLNWTAAVPPWDEPVNGAELLDEIAALLRRFVVLPPNADALLALWTLHTYAYHLRDITAYIGIESPEKRCGKTTLLSILAQLVSRPVAAANISPSAFYRVIEETRPTLLIDEADTYLHGNSELRGILNAGYNRTTAFVVRVANAPSRQERNAQLLPHVDPAKSNRPLLTEERRPITSPSHSLQEESTAPATTIELHPTSAKSPTIHHPQSQLSTFSCWCPKIFAAIGRLPETLADRCLIIRMQRKSHREQCDRLRNLNTVDLRRKCARFVLDHADALTAAAPAIPADLNDRLADISEPLLALADLAGGTWPDHARHVILALAAPGIEHSPMGSLLADILRIFATDQTDRYFSRTLVIRLNQFHGRPWAELSKGKEISEIWLAQKLRPYEIRPRPIWIGEFSGRGYVKDDFAEIFPRYIPRSEIEDLRAQSAANAPAPTPPPTEAAA